MPDFFAPCPRGLEDLLQQDLLAMEATDVKVTEGGVHFSGSWSLCYQVNLYNRLASRVLWRVSESIYRSEQDIYQAAFALQWQRWFDVSQSIRVNTTARRCPLNSLDYVTLLVKDAVCDRFRQQSDQRPDVDTASPDVRIHIYIEDNQLTLYLDTSGEALFKRGYRHHTNTAPIRENLAAGILRLAGWQPGMTLLDPMCGSGTFLLEAAQMSLKIAPGIHRRFGFEHLRNFNPSVWKALKTQAREQQLPPEPLALYGSDIDAQAIQICSDNFIDNDLQACVQLQHCDVLQLTAPADQGVLIANLPYGERMGELEELARLYPQLGDVLKQQFSGWSANLFTADRRILKLMRLKPSRKIPLYNGAIECRLFKYQLVSGSHRK